MASRNYGMAYDTPYNARLLEILDKYDRERDTNGEPDMFEDRMLIGELAGGAFLGADGRVHSVHTLPYHPHLGHAMLGSMAREMDGGKFNLGRAFKSVGHALAPAGREIGKAGLNVAKDVGKYGLQLAQKEGTRRGKEYLDSYMSGEGVYSGGLVRPPGMVSPFVHEPARFVSPGTMGTYPMYNAIEMRGINGGAICGCGVGSGGKFNFGKALGSVAKGVGKIALPIASKVGTKMAEDALMAAVMGAGVSSGGVGIMKKPRGRPRKMVEGSNSTMGGKFNFGKALGSVAKGVGKVALPIATKVGTKVAEDALMAAVMGAGVRRRGRPRKDAVDGGKFNFGKALGSVAKGVGKIAVPIATKVGTKMAEQALTNYMSGEGVMKKGRGRPRKSGGKFNFFKTITDIGKKAGEPFEKSVGVNPFTMGYDLGHDVIAPALMGKGVGSGGAVDGRKKRAEIVKKIMKEKGLKMTDASKYVKQHGLY